jgi:hypothetical protein
MAEVATDEGIAAGEPTEVISRGPSHPVLRHAAMSENSVAFGRKADSPLTAQFGSE